MRLHIRLFVPLAACFVAACATNPVTGKRQLSLVSEAQEIQMGKEASAADVQRIGEYKDAAAQALVTRIGKTISSKSERSQLPWEFHLLDDAAVNAFAYPGGFIFVTRGLMTYLNSEAELAEVIGHEIGHVTAKHTVVAMSKQEVTQIGLVGASILSPAIAKYGDLLGQSASLLFLKFSRDNEDQADALGFKYSLANGYDVRESPKVFATLGRLSDASGARIPEWQSTHPDPGNRVQKAQDRLKSVTPTQLVGTKVNHDAYQQIVDGMIFGEDPRQGYFRGARFLHPQLRFEMTFPSGWKTVNMPDAVVGQSTDGAAQIQLSPGQGTPSAALQAFVGQQGIVVSQRGQTKLNGIDGEQATFDATTQSGAIHGMAVALSYQNSTYLLVGLSTAAGAAQHGGAMDAAIRSFKALTDQSLINVQAAKVQLVTLPEAMTGQAFVQRYPSSIAAAQVYIINAIDANTALPRGMVLKRVTGGVGQ